MNIPQHREQALGMVTAWLTSQPEALDLMRPHDEREPKQLALTADYLALLCATAMSCWAQSINVDPQDLFRDIALSLNDKEQVVKPQ